MPVYLCQVQSVPSCMRAVLPPKNNVWTDSKGELIDIIRVYFFREQLPRVKYNGYPLQCNTIITMVNSYWNCADVVNEDGINIGVHVPSFSDLGTDCNLGDADIRVGFQCKHSSSKLLTMHSRKRFNYK